MFNMGSSVCVWVLGVGVGGYYIIMVFEWGQLRFPNVPKSYFYEPLLNFVDLGLVCIICGLISGQVVAF